MKKNIALAAVLFVTFWGDCPVIFGQPASNPSQIDSSGSKAVSGAAAKAKPISVKVVKAILKEITEEFSTTGSVVADNAVTIKSTAEGTISFCPWREGDSVKEGARLIEIDRPLLHQEMLVAQSALAVAKAKLADLIAGTRREEIAQAQEVVRQREDALNFAKSDHERVSSLVKSGALPAEMEEKSRVSFIKAQTDLVAGKERLSMLKAGHTRTEIAVQKSIVDEAEVKADMARAKYDECFLKAPFSAIITRTHVRTGDLATPRSPLLDLIDPASMVVRFAIPEIYSAKIKEGEEVGVKLDAYPGKNFVAAVNRVYADLDKVTRSRLIEAKIADSSGIELIPGMFARVSAKLHAEKNALVIPDESILSTPRGEKIVFVVKDGKAVQKTIVTGIEQQKSVQVINGLETGDLVVTEGSRSLKDKMAVTVIPGDVATANDKTDNSQVGVSR